MIVESGLNLKKSFDPDYFARLSAIEDRHFWFRTRTRVIGALTRQATGDLPPGYRVLEVGCGTGSVLSVLERICHRGQVIGMDLFAEGLFHARRRVTCPLVQGDAHALPFGSAFHFVGLFDVLEHLSDDQQVLCGLRTLLVPGGVLLLTVPAHRSLWSYFDEASRHCRRYEADELHGKLEHAGYQVEYLTYFMASIYPFVRMWRRLAAKEHPRDSNAVEHTRGLALRELRVVPILNECLSLLLNLESRLIGWRRILPIGTSLVALCRKAPNVRS